MLKVICVGVVFLAFSCSDQVGLYATLARNVMQWCDGMPSKIKRGKNKLLVECVRGGEVVTVVYNHLGYTEPQPRCLAFSNGHFPPQ